MTKISNNDIELFQQFLSFKEMMENKDKQNKKTKTKFVAKRRSKSSGSVYMNSGRRRKPWVAAVTIGVDNITGKAIKHVKSFSSKAEAETYLEVYNLQKKGLITSETLKTKPEANINQCPTVKETWECVLEKEFNDKSEKTVKHYNSLFKHLSNIQNIKLNELSLKDLQPIFDEFERNKKSASLINKIKSILNFIFDYGIKYDYIEKNYVKYVKARDLRESKKIKKHYSHNDIKFLFDHDDDLVAQFILITIYTGMRGSELLSLDKNKIFFEENYMIGGIKTSNGINRVIPIHSEIKEYLNNFIKCKYFGMTYETFNHYFDSFMKNYGLNGFTIHSGRHTFATLCNEYELNEYLIKKIMGHSCKDLTKDVYTHATNERLINEINKLPVFK